MTRPFRPGSCRRRPGRVAVVVGDDPAVALGTVLPRAPHGFWVRHRDGTNRLASLSYLANDPDRIAVAYGVMMPAPGAPERVALVYALARLLDAWQAGSGTARRPGRPRGPLGQKRPLVAAAGAGRVRAGL